MKLIHFAGGEESRMENKVQYSREDLEKWVECNLDFEDTFLPARKDIDHIIDGLESIVNWYNSRCYPGGFLSAVLKNDLMAACSRADKTNKRVLPIYASFIYNKLPLDYTEKAKELWS